MSPVTLPDLVHDARQGDPRAWDELVRRYGGLVAAVARAHRLHEADAADVTQATWLKLVVNLTALRDPAALGGWLATTARRECLRVLRDAARAVPYAEPPERVDDAPGIDAGVLVTERDAQLWGAFARLGQRDQALLRMLAADPPPSYSDISAALGMPIGSIGPTRARALERLRRELDREGQYPAGKLSVRTRFSG
jgi:RNA polymerase sigma factor (sigma-70 family)